MFEAGVIIDPFAGTGTVQRGEVYTVPRVTGPTGREPRSGPSALTPGPRPTHSTASCVTVETVWTHGPGHRLACGSNGSWSDHHSPSSLSRSDARSTCARLREPGRALPLVPVLSRGGAWQPGREGRMAGSSGKDLGPLLHGAEKQHVPLPGRAGAWRARGVCHQLPPRVSPNAGSRSRTRRCGASASPSGVQHIPE